MFTPERNVRDVPAQGQHGRPAVPSDLLDVLERASKLGKTFDAAIRAQRAPRHPKDREQNALLLIAADPSARSSRIADQMRLSSAGFSYLLD